MADCVVVGILQYLGADSGGHGASTFFSSSPDAEFLIQAHPREADQLVDYFLTNMKYIFARYDSSMVDLLSSCTGR